MVKQVLERVEKLEAGQRNLTNAIREIVRKELEDYNETMTEELKNSKSTIKEEFKKEIIAMVLQFVFFSLGIILVLGITWLLWKKRKCCIGDLLFHLQSLLR